MEVLNIYERGKFPVRNEKLYDVIVIGGGVSKAGKILFDYIEKYYKKYAFPSCKDAKFALATLGNDAGIYGAAKLML